MFFLLGWLLYGLFVGYIVKKIHPEEDLIGFVPTLGIGVAGSYIGGAINWLIGFGHEPFAASGILMGILGGLVLCVIYRMYRLHTFVKLKGRKPMYRMPKK